MATVLLSAAGSAIGGSIGGSILGLSSAALGQAVGATLGGLVDNAIFGASSAPREVGRREALRLPSASEGAAINRVFGRMRTSGQLIWSTRYRENVTTSNTGAKGGPQQTTRTYSYSISFALGLCEGEIDRIGRCWADGQLLDLTRFNHRIYRGTEFQEADEKIAAVEGEENAPAYRGLAYVVFEDFPVGEFGNRVPVLNFEVYRSPNVSAERAEALGLTAPLRDLVKGVCLSPGTGEFALETQPVRYTDAGGNSRYANINNSFGVPDAMASLDQLDGDLPGCETVSLVVAWFGTDLRCGACRIEPRIESRDKSSWPYTWSVAGMSFASAPIVSADANGRPNFGGTPSDASVIAIIRELKARGKKVMIYPFLLMDIPAGNTLPDPWSGAASQPAFPWRGRITLSAAPGQAATPDQSAAAAAEVASFFGTAAPGDFAVSPGTVGYSGPAEWTMRRFVLHLAALAQAAGGVDSFCVGTEMRSLTQIRSDRTTFPAVEAYRALAADVATMLPDAQIGYAADWSEYFGYHPSDGTGDLFFHLDPLWSDPAIDFVGIDNYMPLADWRYDEDHADLAAGWESPYETDYLRSQIEGGEGFDWYYRDQSERDQQIRTPITDGAFGESWVYRYKDIRSWWSNPHHDRVDGVRSASPTGWAPQSKPIWFTEIGCPAVDLGANQPNVFVDSLSSESALPHYSRGARDDLIQNSFLHAQLSWWSDPSKNPVSGIYGDRMIPEERIYVWTWDTRPWPDFPMRQSLWKDGPKHAAGHWISGRVASNSLSAVIAELGERAGLGQFDVSRVYGSLDGLLIDNFATTRQIVESLAISHDLQIRQSADRIEFFQDPGSVARSLVADELLDRVETTDKGGEPTEGEADAVQLQFVRGDVDFRAGVAEARVSQASAERGQRVSVPVSMAPVQAMQVAERLVAANRSGQEQVRFDLPLSHIDLEVGDCVTIAAAGAARRYRISEIRDDTARHFDAVALHRHETVPATLRDADLEAPGYQPPAPLRAVFLDLPIASGGAEDHWPLLAVAADPWPGHVDVYRSARDGGYAFVSRLDRPAVIGTTLDELPPGQPGRWQRGIGFRVAAPAGRLASATADDVLNGANRAALLWPDGSWEVFQFEQAELVAAGEYRLSGLLRGQRQSLVPDRLNTVLAPGAVFILLDDAVEPVPLDLDLRGLDRHYRIVPAGVGLEHFSVSYQVMAFDTVGLRPLAPRHPTVSRDSTTGDFIFGWIRSSRLASLTWSAGDAPLDEPGLAFRITVLDGTTIARVAEVTEPTWRYTAADQAADGISGGFTAEISQLSTFYGSGLPTRVNIDG